MFKIESKINHININMSDVFKEVCILTINEIKRLIKSGKNINNESLIKKNDGKTPDFYDTGRMLNSLTYKVTDTGFDIYFSDTERSLIAYHLQQQKNWILLDETPYIRNFITSKIDEILQKKLNSI